MPRSEGQLKEESEEEKEGEETTSEEEKDEKPWVVYMLRSTCGRKTYVGASNNVFKRRRQHSGEIAGGAKATRGYQWEIICFVSGFKDNKHAFKFEWRVKNAPAAEKVERKGVKVNYQALGMSTPKGRIRTRIHCLLKTLCLERYTASSPLSKLYPLVIHWQNNKYCPTNLAAWLPAYVTSEKKE